MRRSASPTRSSRAGALCLAAALVAGSLAGCDWPFGTRDAESPESESKEILPQTSAANVLKNLELAMENDLPATYMDLFASDFAFHPDPSDSLAFANSGRTSVYDNWGVDREAGAYGAIWSAASSMSLTITETGELDAVETCLVDSCRTEHSYVLTVKREGQVDLVLQGRMRLTIAQAGQEWRIRTWSDFQPADQAIPSWGWFKGDRVGG